MAQYTLPLLFLNLGGEMLYILDQRLKAQKIPIEKSRKVLNEIAGIMLNQRFLDELFKPQEVYNKGALCTLFHDLAHASIMRLNEASMSKLYDLMTMAFKQQVFFAREPKDLILITLNHLDNMRYLVTMPTIHKQLDSAYFLVIKTYGQMTFGELQRVRYNILNFFQDMRVRVSIFLRQQIQNNDGTFKIPTDADIPYGNEVPGSIRVFGNDGCIADLLSFNPGGSYTVAPDAGSTELRGTRHISLGTNMYSTSKAEPTWDQPGLDSDERWDGNESKSSYREELNLLLTQLLGNQQRNEQQGGCDFLRLNLFEGQEEEEQEESTSSQDKPNVEDQSSMTNEQYANTIHKIKSEIIVDAVGVEKPLTVLDLLDLV